MKNRRANGGRPPASWPRLPANEIAQVQRSDGQKLMRGVRPSEGSPQAAWDNTMQELRNTQLHGNAIKPEPYLTVWLMADNAAGAPHGAEPIEMQRGRLCLQSNESRMMCECKWAGTVPRGLYRSPAGQRRRCRPQWRFLSVSAARMTAVLRRRSDCGFIMGLLWVKDLPACVCWSLSNVVEWICSVSALCFLGHVWSWSAPVSSYQPAKKRLFPKK